MDRLLLLAAILAAPSSVFPQDIVVTRGPDGDLKQRGGVVKDCNADQLILEVNGREQKIPFEQIVRVQSSLDPLAALGDQLYAERKFELAYEAYGKGIEATTPAWMRRRLLAGRVKSAFQMQAWVQATTDFLALVQSDSRTEYFGEIPLIWSAPRPDAAVARRLSDWLSSENPVEQLIGASHGLTDLNRDRALKILSTLANHPDPRIADLAAAQRWRANVSPTPATLRQWEARIEKMPPGLRAGPTFVLGTAWIKSDPEQGALQLLRIPVLDGQQFELAARALTLAADQLLSLKRPAEAKLVLQELVDRHAGTAEADLAAQKLARLGSTESGNSP